MNKFSEVLDMLKEEEIMGGTEECEYDGMTRRGIFFRVFDEATFVEYYEDELTSPAFYDVSRDPNSGGIVDIHCGNPYKMEGYIALEKIPQETLEKLLSDNTSDVKNALRILREMC